MAYTQCQYFLHSKDAANISIKFNNRKIKINLFQQRHSPVSVDHIYTDLDFVPVTLDDKHLVMVYSLALDSFDVELFDNHFLDKKMEIVDTFVDIVMIHMFV